jgi:hypothetical protein
MFIFINIHQLISSNGFGPLMRGCKEYSPTKIAGESGGKCAKGLNDGANADRRFVSHVTDFALYTPARV